MSNALQISVLLAAFLTSAIAVKWSILVLQRWQVLDVPNGRSSHAVPTPRAGGVGIIFGIVAGLTVAAGLSAQVPGWGLLLGAAIVATVGLLDDCVSGGLPIFWRLLAHYVAAVIVVYTSGGWDAGTAPAFLGSSFPSVTPWIVVFWIVAVVNFYNFLDGIDGFAGVQGVIAGLGIAVLSSSEPISVTGLAIAGGCSGFLIFNWHPARIFMGDVGSTTIGFLLAAAPLMVGGAERLQTIGFMALLLWFFLADGVSTLVRRLLRGERIWTPHRTHLYQRLAATGLAHSEIVMRVGAASTFLVTLSVILLKLEIPNVEWILSGMAFFAFAAYWQWTVFRETQADQDSDATQQPVGQSKQRTANAFLFAYRRILSGAYHATIFAVALAMAFLLRFDFDIPETHAALVFKGLAILLPIKLIIFAAARLNHGWWRYVGLSDVVRLFVANLIASSTFILVGVFALGPRFPRSVYCIDLLLCFFFTAAGRFVVRIYTESNFRGARDGLRRKIVIYGAGAAAMTLVREIRANQALAYEIVGFVDDDPRKRGAILMGISVLGNGRSLAKIVKRWEDGPGKIEEVIVAMPSASPAKMQEAVTNCQAAGVACKTIPGLGQLLTGMDLRIRDVSVKDLLGREPVQIEDERIRERILGRSVLVTGGAGSIGSEICRQIASFDPRALIALDQAESDLYRLDLELRKKFPNLNVVCAVGDIRDSKRLNEVISQHDVESIFHAAAYKHVPMMESHPLEAIRNNVFGTYDLVQAAYHHSVKSFLMISSDKAVNPTSIMGVTKRVTELIVSAMPQDRTKFVSVRFGNVLGSNGSAVPLFRSQIEAGGPVTITHPDMRRYFMTIPEAVQLVLLASTMGRGSEIFVLDMGDPVRIVDLARNMIRLCGRSDKEIELRFVGIRPGEKLYEELQTKGENVSPTSHPKISIFHGARVELRAMESWLMELQELLRARDDAGCVAHLVNLVPEYKPDRIWRIPEKQVMKAAAS